MITFMDCKKAQKEIRQPEKLFMLQVITDESKGLGMPQTTLSCHSGSALASEPLLIYNRKVFGGGVFSFWKTLVTDVCH